EDSAAVLRAARAFAPDLQSASESVAHREFYGRPPELSDTRYRRINTLPQQEKAALCACVELNIRDLARATGCATPLSRPPRADILQHCGKFDYSILCPKSP